MSRRGIKNLNHRSHAESIELGSIPEPNSGCWLWLGSLNSWGYGRFGKDKPERQAHRLSYVTFVGPIPVGARVLHRCDMPCCVNPNHLWLGTDSDNVRDALRKGRHVAPKGEQQAASKLTWHAAAEIRSSSETISELARRFGVSRRAIRFVKDGKTWRQ